MDKVQTIKMVKQALEDIAAMRRNTLTIREVDRWKDRVCRIIEDGYGKESVEYRRFVNAPGKAFLVRTETGEQQECHRRLDCYEEVLKELVDHQ